MSTITQNPNYDWKFFATSRKHGTTSSNPTNSTSQEQGQQTRPVTLLILGISRTGTSSLRLALSQLIPDYKTFHMHEMVSHHSRFFPFFIAAQKNKFGSPETYAQTPLTRRDFDGVFAGEYDAISDLPAVLFTPELLAAYPDAKVILTMRDPDRWVESISRTIWKVHTWWTWDYIAPLPLNGLIRGWRECDTLNWDAFINSTPLHEEPGLYPKRRDYLSADYRRKALERFREHTEWMRGHFLKDRMLEFQPGDGWEPLCRFFGVDVPRDEEGNVKEYPRVWEGDELVKAARMMWYFGVFNAVVVVCGPVIAAVGIAWWLRRV